MMQSFPFLQKHPRSSLILLLFLLAFSFLLSLLIGEALGPRALWACVWGGGDEFGRTILWQFRLPRSLVGAAVGAALASSGLVMQAYFRNPLASPGLLGVSSGGALGAVFALAVGWASCSLWSVPLAAIAGAGLATTAVLLMARRGSGPEHLLLAGVAMNALLGAGTSLILDLTSGRFELSGQILFWLMGSLESRTWEHVWMVFPGVLGACALLLPLGRSMNLLALGEASAQSLGVDVRRLGWLLIGLSTLLTALATAVGGVIGFVGLVVPHILRLLLGPDHTRLLPFSMIGGAVFVLLCDSLTRMLPSGLHLGVLTALVGGPFFLALLLRPDKRRAI